MEIKVGDVVRFKGGNIIERNVEAIIGDIVAVECGYEYKWFTKESLIKVEKCSKCGK